MVYKFCRELLFNATLEIFRVALIAIAIAVKAGFWYPIEGKHDESQTIIFGELHILLKGSVTLLLISDPILMPPHSWAEP